MENTRFWLFSPSGNDTLFLEKKHDSCGSCRKGMSLISAEQCGITDINAKTLRMAAGEFCANASRAFACLLDLETGGTLSGWREYSLIVSGCDAPVKARVYGVKPLWQCEAEFIFPSLRLCARDANSILAHFPGISHLFIKSENFPKAAELETQAGILRERHGLDDKPAAGVVWWRENDGIYEIYPYISVPAAATAMLESSCGSATLGLAAIFAGRRLAARQPGGEILDACFDAASGRATLAGQTRLLAQGQIFV